MSHARFVVPAPVRGRLRGLRVLLGGFALVAATAWAGQQPPPIEGVTGTVALEGTVVQEGVAANTIIVKTTDGVRHVFHFTKDLLVHGGKRAGVDALADLRDGSTVVVHYTVTGADASALEVDRVGDEGLKVAEGMVTRVDRRRKEIIVRFDNGKTETFQLTERAAVDAGKDVDRAANGTTRVVVYYTDDAGRKVAHFFKLKS